METDYINMEHMRNANIEQIFKMQNVSWNIIGLENFLETSF